MGKQATDTYISEQQIVEGELDKKIKAVMKRQRKYEAELKEAKGL